MAGLMAVVSSNAELEAAKELAGNERIAIVCHDFWPSEGAAQGNTELVRSQDFLQGGDAQKVEERAAFFARNWYKFDAGFENAIVLDGISLGFVHENELAGLLKNAFFALKSVARALERERPAKLLVNRNSFAGRAAAIAAGAKGVKEIAQLDAKPEQAYMRFPNLERRKFKEIFGKKIPMTLKGIAGSSGRKQGKTIFVRARWYFDELKAELGKKPGTNVFSLDDFLVKRLLNPLNAYRYFSSKARERKRFRKIFERLAGNEGFSKKLVFDGMNFSEMLQGMFPRLVNRDWPEFSFLVSELSGLFEREKPSALVLWQDFVPFERICALLARRHGVKSIVIQNGMITVALKKGDWIRGYAPLTADKIAVWGELYKKCLVSHGVPAGSVVVTGPPRFDSLHSREFNAGSIRQKLGIKEGEKIVVLAADLFMWKSARTRKEFDETAKAVGKVDGARLVVKLHPSDDPVKCKKFIGNRGIVVQQIDLYELLNASDAVINKSSTVGLEAMALGKPVIVFAAKLSQDSLFAATNAVLKARSVPELEKAIKEAIYGSWAGKRLEKEMQRFVFMHAFRQDGMATARVINAIREMTA